MRIDGRQNAAGHIMTSVFSWISPVAYLDVLHVLDIDHVQGSLDCGIPPSRSYRSETANALIQ
jgi:hypothetical protein